MPHFFGFAGWLYTGNLWPGSWTLELRLPDGRTWRKAFTVRAGESVELVME